MIRRDSMPRAAESALAIGRLLKSGEFVGTAFAIGPSLAITCHHCVAGVGEFSLAFTGKGPSSPVRVVEVVTVGDSRDNDFALLRLAAPVEQWIPLCADELIGEVGPLHVLGFPQVVPEGAAVRLNVEFRGTQRAEYGDYQIDDAIALGGDAAAVGMSGAPVLDGRTLGAIAMVVGGPGFLGRTFALPFAMLRGRYQDSPALRFALDWNRGNSRLMGWAMNAEGAADFCRAQVRQAIERLSRQRKFDASTFVQRDHLHSKLVANWHSEGPFAVVGPANVGKTSFLASLASQHSGCSLLFDAFSFEMTDASLLSQLESRLSEAAECPAGGVLRLLAAGVKERNRELIVCLDAVNEVNGAHARIDAWLAEAITDCRESGIKLVVSSRGEFWSSLGARDDIVQIDIEEFSSDEAQAASIAYGLESRGFDGLLRHPLMFRIARELGDVGTGAPVSRFRAVRRFVEKLLAPCSRGSETPRSLLLSLERLAGATEDDNISWDLAANQLGGNSRIDELVDAGIFKAQELKYVRFAFDEFTEALRPPLDRSELEFTTLWQAAIDDAALRRRLSASAVRSESDEDPRLFDANMRGLRTAIASRAPGPPAQAVQHLQSLGSAVRYIASAIGDDNGQRLNAVRGELRAAFVAAYAVMSKYHVDYSRLELDVRDKALVLIELLPMLSDFGLRPKDLFDRGGSFDLLRRADKPVDAPSMLLHMLRHDRERVRRLLIFHLDDRRPLKSLGNDRGETDVGELLCSLLRLTAEVETGELLGLLLESRHIARARGLVRDIAGDQPMQALDHFIGGMGTAQGLALMDYVNAALRSAGPGNAPPQVIEKLRQLMSEATIGTRTRAAELVRTALPDDVTAWDVVCAAVVFGRSECSLLPVPAARFERFVDALEGMPPDAAISDMNNCDDAELQQRLAGVAQRLLHQVGPDLRSKLGLLAEHKLWRLEKSSDFAEWVDFAEAAAAHPGGEPRSAIAYFVLPHGGPRADVQRKLFPLLLDENGSKEVVRSFLHRLVESGGEDDLAADFLGDAVRLRPDDAADVADALLEKWTRWGLMGQTEQESRLKMKRLDQLIANLDEVRPEFAVSLRTRAAGMIDSSRG